MKTIVTAAQRNDCNADVSTVHVIAVHGYYTVIGIIIITNTVTTITDSNKQFRNFRRYRDVLLTCRLKRYVRRGVEW